MQQKMGIPKYYLDILNQLFEIEQKASKVEGHTIQRNINKLKDLFENGIHETIKINYYNPIGESYNETRTDCEASIAGESTEDLVITEVIKPIIRISQNGITQIVQKAIVIAKSENSKS